MDFKVLLILCCLLAASHSRHLDVKLTSLGNRIVGGEEAFPGQFPHQVALLLVEPNSTLTFFCGGTILNERWILTAVHCVTRFENQPTNAFFNFIVSVGRHDLMKEESSAQISVVEKYFKHKLYDEELKTPPYDIALLKLQTPLTLNKRVAIAVLPKNNSEPTGQVTLSGWGAINKDDIHNPIYSTILHTVTVPIIERNTCNEAIKKISAEEGEPMDIDLVNETNVCTGPLTGGISGCEGDSGGPLVRKNDKNETEVVGIAAWAMTRCGRKGGPTIYVRVSYFIDWIENIINNN